MKFDKGQHCVYKLNMHMILVVKYRRNVINEDISLLLKNQFLKIAKLHDVELLEWNFDANKPDHIHILFKMKPQTCISKFVNGYKASSSRLVKVSFPEIKNQLWKDKFWSQSYFISAVSDVNEDIVKKYILDQGEYPDRRLGKNRHMKTKSKI